MSISRYIGAIINRSDVFSALQTRSPDVLIIGAGCNGAGIFRDMAHNGVDVLLIDRDDFGANLLSTPLVHGSIHYFENGQFRLAGQAARERDYLIENAPQLVRPLPIVMAGIKPFKHGILGLRTGLVFYDWLTHADGSLPAHKFEAREGSLAEYPSLSQKIEYTATYYDGQNLSPERLTVELILDGEAEGPHARALNYVSFSAAQAGKFTLKDDLTGESFDLQPRLIVKAAGPASALPAMGASGETHLVLRHPELRAAIGKRGFSFESQAGGSLLILPYYDRVVVTISNSAGNDIERFANLVARIFPAIDVTRAHILAKWPAQNAGQIARDQGLEAGQWAGLPDFSVPVGDWTGFRAESERVTDQVLISLGRPRRGDTKMLPVGGGRDYPRVGIGQIEFVSKVASETGLGELQPKKLFYRYGTRALEIAHYLRAGIDMPLVSRPDWTRREVEFLVAHEKALHVDDILLRRSCLVRLGEVTRALVTELVEVMGAMLDWTDAQNMVEMQRVFPENITGR